LLIALVAGLVFDGSLQQISGQYDFSSDTDIGVHRIYLYRRAGPEDLDLARSERNVLVSIYRNPRNKHLITSM
jgi:hypothetical protein